MLKLELPEQQIILPTEPSVRLEPAIDCHGSICHIGIYDDEDGEVIDISPHFHIVENEPGVGTRSYAKG